MTETQTTEREQEPSRLERLNNLSYDVQKKIVIGSIPSPLVLMAYGFVSDNIGICLTAVASGASLVYLAARSSYLNFQKRLVGKTQ